MNQILNNVPPIWIVRYGRENQGREERKVGKDAKSIHTD